MYAVLRKYNLKILKPIIFIFIGIILLFFIQDIFIPKRYSTLYPSNPQRVVEGLLKSNSNNINVLFLGTSHMSYGISPIELYQEYGIKSYNAATDLQTPDISYFLLKETLAKNPLSLVVMDASSLYLDYFDEASYRKILDSAPLSRNKIHLFNEYKKLKSSNGLEVLFPIYEYHSRWNELTAYDFLDMILDKNYYTKGYTLESGTVSPWVTQDFISSMNEEATYMNGDINQKLEYIENGNKKITYTPSIVYPNNIPERNIHYLKLIKELCDDNSISFLLTKIPSVNSPTDYPSAWSYIRHQKVKKLAQENAICYFDLLYDGKLDLDWSTASMDGGGHLNIIGATQTSSFMGKYLMYNYTLDSNSNPFYEEDLKMYKKMKAAAFLESENNYVKYIKLLNSYSQDNLSIIISSYGKLDENMCTELLEPLKALGAEIDFQDIINPTYVFISENGTRSFELLSNRLIKHSGQLLNGASYDISCVGYYSWFNQYVCINNQNHSVGAPGINIIVYDNQLNSIIDSVAFTYNNVNTISCLRKSPSISSYRTTYEDKLMLNSVLN